MKNLFKIVFTTAILFAYLQSNADESIVKYSELQWEAFTINLGLITDKFDNYGGASVQFNSNFIALKIDKRFNCPKGQVCPMLMPLPEVINLEVVKVVHTDCKDIYYAKTASNVKSVLFEQITLEDNSSRGCQYFVATPAGRLLYRVSGKSNATEKQGYADVLFTLKSIKELNLK